jgi:lipoteichoic acid synthase
MASALLAARILSVLGLYLLPTPSGHLVLPHPEKFIPVAIASDVGTLLLLTAACLGIARRLAPGWRAWTLRAAYAAAGVAYGVVAQIDVEIRRWIGLRFNLVFIRQLLSGGGEAGFWRQLGIFLRQDAPGILWAIGCVLLPAGVAAVWLARRRPTPAVSARRVGALAAAGVVAFGLSVAREPALRKWRLAAPIEYGVALDLGREWSGGNRPRDERRALDDLKALAGNPDGRDDYPLWHDVPDDEARMAAFRRRPLAERPDVVVVVVESLRAWRLDWRAPWIDTVAPHLASLWRERGVAFTHAHSNGFPSGEGNMNLQLGLWSHPARAIYAEYAGVATRSLSEILGDAGYERWWFTGSDPSFDNMLPWVRRDFDGYDVEDTDDMTLARRFLARYDEMDPGAPRFMTMYTASMHTPYHLPAGEGPTPADVEAAYLRALSFTDRAIGLVVDHVRRSPRWAHTIIVVVGDHSQPSQWQLAHGDDLGAAHAGYSWTGLLVTAPGLAGGTIDDRTASHVDVAPTVLALMGLVTSHHFLGSNLLAPPVPGRRALSVMYEDFDLIEGGVGLEGSLADERFVRKVRYDPGVVGELADLEGGTLLQPTPEDLEAVARTRDALREYTSVLDRDRLRPPGGALER